MANGASIIIGLVFVIIASLLAYFFSPKGETQTIWRSTIILSFASCYLLWGAYLHFFRRSRPLLSAITFLAQWHPLIFPTNTSLRPEYVH